MLYRADYHHKTPAHVRWSLNIARVSALQPQPQLKYFPTNYGGIGDYYDNAITVADFPICLVQDVSYLTTLNKNTELAQIAAAQLQFNTQNSLFSTGVSGVAGVLDNAIRGMSQGVYKAHLVQG